uniref:Aa_trans domain-containing protein n=1 Tax=Heterorhabditis bacteriophora TaxID=37862 RepID=A0A1I7WQX2_HETBA
MRAGTVVQQKNCMLPTMSFLLNSRVESFHLLNIEFRVDRLVPFKQFVMDNPFPVPPYNCWVQLWNVFFIFFVTLTIFPAMMASTPLYIEPGQGWHSIWPSKVFFFFIIIMIIIIITITIITHISENLYTFITTFLSFNVFATLGSMIANFVQWPRPDYLWIPVLLRGLFIPFFMFCNYRPADRTIPIFFKSEWLFLIAGIMMALTSGYFSSLGMMYAPRIVPGNQAKIVGMTAALCLILGMFTRKIIIEDLKMFLYHSI